MNKNTNRIRCHHWLLFIGILSFPSIGSSAKEAKLSEFSQDVTLHVLFHELGHALIREFDLPILTNEEATADSFSTVWITQNIREQAPRIIIARTRSWLHEDSKDTSDNYDFKGEHLLDIRRAYQTACLFYGLDPAEHSQHIEWLEFSTRDLSDCSDTAPDQERSWLELLEPYRLSEKNPSTKVELIYGDGPMKATMQHSGILDMFLEHVRLFNWPNNITVHFNHCDKGAFWNRSERNIVLCDEYVQRFVQQGEFLKY